MRQTTSNFIFLLALPGILWITSSGCGTFKKLGGAFGSGLADSLETINLDLILQASAAKVLNEAVKTERFELLEKQLDGSLDRLGNKAHLRSDHLLKDVLIARTDEWIKTADADLQNLITRSKNNLTDGQLKNYLHDLEEDLSKALQHLLDDLSNSLHSGELHAGLNTLRISLGLEMDTLIEGRFDLLMAKTDEELMPRIDSLLAKIVRQRTATRRDVSSIIWIASLAALGIALAVFLIKTHILKLKYRKMMEITTAEINGIGAQQEYDRLVRSINERMKAEGLEALLRKKILEKQGLLDQDEWSDKDKKLLKLLVEYEAKPSSNGDNLYQELRKQDLEAHFLSKRLTLPD